MAMRTESYLEKIEQYVTKLFLSFQEDNLIYHNLTHTRKVVFHCREMSAYYSLDKHDDAVLSIAAWFHDTGQLLVESDKHEMVSVLLMKKFAAATGLSDMDTGKIEQCILSTRLPQQPGNLLENILCDADLYHLGTEEFLETDRKVKEEIEQRNNIKIDHWTEKSLKFLEDHTYFTEYCQGLLNNGKNKNILLLKRLLDTPPSY